MNLWNNFPMVRVLLPFIIGIVLCNYIEQFDTSVIYVLFILLFILWTIKFVIIKRVVYRLEGIYGAVLFLWLMGIGYAISWYGDDIHLKNHYSRFSSEKEIVSEIKVISKPVIKPKTVKVEAEVLRLFCGDGKVREVHGKVLIYFNKDSLSEQIAMADKLLLCSKYNPVSTVRNPGEFDYGRYLKHQSIHYRLYVNKDNWSWERRSKPFTYGRFFSDWQELLSGYLNNQKISSQYQELLGALILGNRANIESDVISGFTNTGLIHVLSVSGMHVGLIYLVLNFLFFKNRFLKDKRWLKVLIILTFLWFYALVTGFSPSVIRATIMFSFILFSQALARNNNIYNSIAGSAFLILFFDPMALFNVGFQLSYLAVLGIVTLYPLVYRWVYFDNKLFKQIWSLIAVSLSAQLLTLPVTLYYFHQFPTYFLIANLLVLPIITVVIYLGIVLMLVSPITYLSNLLAWLIVKMLNVVLYVVGFVEKLPQATIEGITFSFWDLIYCFAVILFFLFWVHQPKRIFLKGMCLVVLLWLINGVYVVLNRNNHKELIVYAIPKSTMIAYFEGAQCWVWSDDNISKDGFLMNYYIKKGWVEKGINKQTWISLESKYKNEKVGLWNEGGKLQVKGKKILLLSKENINEMYCDDDRKIEVDYCVISQSPFVDFEKLIKTYKIKKMVVDGSNTFKTARFLKYKCKKYAIPFVNLKEEYACIENIEE